MVVLIADFCRCSLGYSPCEIKMVIQRAMKLLIWEVVKFSAGLGKIAMLRCGSCQRWMHFQPPCGTQQLSEFIWLNLFTYLCCQDNIYLAEFIYLFVFDFSIGMSDIVSFVDGFTF